MGFPPPAPLPTPTKIQDEGNYKEFLRDKSNKDSTIETKVRHASPSGRSSQGDRARHVLSLNDFKVIDVRAGIIREDPDSAGRHRSR